MKQDIRRLLRERIFIMDGAMGTMIQQQRLNEADFRGTRFADWPSDLKGNNDLLCLTLPAVIENIHFQYLEAGADIIETNTFNAQSVSLADYGMQQFAYEINVAAAQCARNAVARFLETPSGKEKNSAYVAGAMGPMNKTLSLSPDVNNPGYRAFTFDEAFEAYHEQVSGLVDGGVDLLIVETIFDTLNAKAALAAIARYQRDHATQIPVMISGTITDASGRTLSGQTLEAFYISVKHARPLSIGLNCALGAKEMRSHIEELSKLAENSFISAYPNAGLPNAMGEYDEQPAQTAGFLKEWAQNGWVNLVGGCCGTTPAHIREIAHAVKDLAPRIIPAEAIEIPETQEA